MGEAEGSQAEADDLSGGTQKNCGGSESTMGEGETRRLTHIAGQLETGACRRSPWTVTVVTPPGLEPLHTIFREICQGELEFPARSIVKHYLVTETGWHHPRASFPR